MLLRRHVWEKWDDGAEEEGAVVTHSGGDDEAFSLLLTGIQMAAGALFFSLNSSHLNAHKILSIQSEEHSASEHEGIIFLGLASVITDYMTKSHKAYDVKKNPALPVM